MSVEFVGGRPCVVILDSCLLWELSCLLDQLNRQRVYAGDPPVPVALDVAAAARHAHAIAQLVPLAEPLRGELGQPKGRWISTADAAERLGITQRAVRKRIARGHLGGRRLGGRWFVDMKEICPDAAA